MDKDYETLYILGVVFPALLFVATLFAPESAVWLRKRNGSTSDGAGAGAAATTIGETAPLLSGTSNSDLSAHSPTIDAEQRHEVGGWAGLFSKRHLSSLMVGIVLAVALALTGINAVMFYAPTIFELSGFADKKQLLTVLVGACNFFSTIVGILLYRCFSRRVMLVACLCIISVSLVALAAALQFAIDQKVNSAMYFHEKYNH